MTRSKYKIEIMGLVFFSIIILFSLLYVETPLEIALSQTISSSNSFPVENFTFPAILYPQDIQKNEYKSLPKDHVLEDISLASNPSSSNPAYSVTNTTISVKTGVLQGTNNDKMILINQSIIIPEENSIVGVVQ